MDDDFLHLLDMLYVFGGHNNRYIGQALHFATALAEQSHALDPYLAGDLEGAHKVAGAAARAYAQEHIPRLAEGFYLAGERVLVAYVVGPGCQRCTVRAQGERGQAGAVG